MIKLDFGTKKATLDFENKKDVAATFIVAKIYYDYDDNSNTRFQTGITMVEEPPANTSTGNTTSLKHADTSLQRNARLVGSIIAKSQQITLALWDDALEDGDSISLSINGKCQRIGKLKRGKMLNGSCLMRIYMKDGVNA